MNDQAQTPTLRLKGRRVLVTGAASGIGRSTAELFAREGAAVALLDRDKGKLQAVAEQIGGWAFPVDITDDEAVASSIAEAAATMSGIDGVVNAAGIMFRGRAIDVSAPDWRKVIEINLTGTYNVVRGCIPWLLQEPSATVVTIASAAGLLPNAAEYTAYAASKGGVVALTKALAAELAPTIRVNTVCPGMVDTAMADGHRGNVGNYALNRLADPVEIARSILFLTSQESSYITGTALAVDGGRTFH
ncbi:SDR family NAD(P)-dependent oxidoreductase [Arthrobacter sp. BE255]|uniref:SDR family NAD(P)-dependent oxidoreductase n=1 Tax=Arthrobacter sp. BE255 TaxID=2817721 RepID=UPI0028582839|nr:SDR family NAD(P)-dependent oxidoreductase [Arthrobacter sp. BE255]MDR7161928.1 3-oxoacyl-[acyl-carrier protein] reductase [Arthrobacter sp. BE255]